MRGAVQQVLRRWMGDYVVAIVVAMVLFAPLLWLNSGQGGTLYRSVGVQVMGVLLLSAVLLRLDVRPGNGERLGRFLASGINAPVLLLFVWGLISAFWVVPEGVGRAFALNELLRLGTGVLIYLVVANHVENRRQMETLIDGVLIILAIATLYRIFAPHTLSASASLLGQRLLSGAFLCLLLPVAAAAAVMPMTARRQIAARVVLVLTIVTLLVTPTRSSWIGAVVGMALFAGLALRHVTGGFRSLRANAHRTVYPLVALGGALVLLLTLSDISHRVTGRVSTLPSAAHGHDENFQARRKQWQGTWRAIARHPVFGFGIGGFVLKQQAFTKTGRTEQEVVREGPTMQEQAHNEYLHLAAELGLPGLLLYLLMLLAFFAKAFHAVGRLPAGGRKVLLIGCTSSIAAQCVDAMSNPAWRYPQCSVYFWLVLGVGIALVRMASRAPIPHPSPPQDRSREGMTAEAPPVVAA